MLAKLMSAVCAIALAATTAASAQSVGPQAAPWLFLGPRLAVAGEITQPPDFNTEIQRFYPSTSSYFPVYSQVGLELSEWIPIGGSGYRLSLGEQVLVSGLDQNFALPVVRLMLGVHTSFGLEVGLGPQLELVNTGTIGVAPSLVYSLGWRFAIGAMSLPVSVIVDPLPPERKIRVSVLAGVDYGFAPARPAPQAPFNY